MAKRNPAVFVAGLAFAVMAAGFAYNLFSGGPKVWGSKNSDRTHDRLTEIARSGLIPAVTLSDDRELPQSIKPISINGIQLEFENLQPQDIKSIDPNIPVVTMTWIAAADWSADEFCKGSYRPHKVSVPNPETGRVTALMAICSNQGSLAHAFGESQMEDIEKLPHAMLRHIFDKPLSENKK